MNPITLPEITVQLPDSDLPEGSSAGVLDLPGGTLEFDADSGFMIWRNLQTGREIRESESTLRQKAQAIRSLIDPVIVPPGVAQAMRHRAAVFEAYATYLEGLTR